MTPESISYSDFLLFFFFFTWSAFALPGSHAEYHITLIVTFPWAPFGWRILRLPVSFWWAWQSAGLGTSLIWGLSEVFLLVQLGRWVLGSVTRAVKYCFHHISPIWPGSLLMLILITRWRSICFHFFTVMILLNISSHNGHRRWPMFLILHTLQ